MFPSPVDKLLKEIASLKDRNRQLTSETNCLIQTLKTELGFLKMFIWLLPGRSGKNHYIRATVGNGKLGLYGDCPVLDLVASKLLQKIELCKQKIREDCLHVLDIIISSQRKFSSSIELVHFINCTLTNLSYLVHLKTGAIVNVKSKARDLINKLKMFKEFVEFTRERLAFRIDIQRYASMAAYISIIYWYWVDQMDEMMASRMKAIITGLLQMVNSYSPEVMELYTRVLRVSKFLPTSNKFEIGIGDIVANFVDFILPLGFMKILRQDFIFLLAFLHGHHPPVKGENKWNLVLTKAKAVACEIPTLICSLADGVGDMSHETSKGRDVLLGDFQRKAREVMKEVKKLYFHIPRSSRSHFPATNALGFIDFFLGNLGNLKETVTSDAKFLPFARDLILTLHQELTSLRPFLAGIDYLINEFEELKEFLMKITNAVYRADYVLDSCQILDLPIWHYLICLSDIIEEVKFLNKQIGKIMASKKYASRILSTATMDSGNHHLRQAFTSRLDEVVVGFSDEEEKIINQLIRGTKKLQIVSIFGMPGQGKTTLAKKIYNSSSVRQYFRKHAWCYVTQVYEVESLLMDVFKEVDDGTQNSNNQDLADKVRKCLMGRRYLIVMDDIWDMTAWNALKESFPDNENGSRILFTSRNKLVCNSHLLRRLSEEECKELLDQMLLDRYGWLFLDGTKQILEVCNGLPLAIVAVAGLLAKVSTRSEWKKIVKDLNSKLPNEGCLDILELSYKSLPDFLKPCFLYLGTVGQTTKVFKVRKFIHLWIAEGFIQKSGTKNLEEVAMEYLENLVSRSLIIVNKRSYSSGEIKECRVHDLMHEMCLRKCQEERFLQYSNSSSKPILNSQYRLCIYDAEMLNSWFPRSNLAGSNIRSLLLPPLNIPFLYPYETTSAFFMRLKFVRVLDLGSLNFRHCFPEEILLLICLRYVSIRCEVVVIPPSIGNLCYLEILHLIWRDWRKIKFPYTIWKMKRLKFIDVGPGAIILSDDCETKVCPQLFDLHSFSSLHLCNIEDAEKILRGFPNVRKLKLELSESWDCKLNCCDRLFQVLNNFLSKLESLSLKCCRKMDHTCELNFPEALKSLTLSRFFLKWNELSTIGKLPNLEVLKLLDSTIVGGKWDVEDDAFLNLKYLKLLRIVIFCWEVPNSSFPCLERLVLRECYYLEQLPSALAEIPNLNFIEVRWCKECLPTSAESIQREQLDMGNEDLKVLIDMGNEDLKVLINHVREDYFTAYRSLPCLISHFMPQDLNRLTGLFKSHDFNIFSVLFDRDDFDIILAGLLFQPDGPAIYVYYLHNCLPYGKKIGFLDHYPSNNYHHFNILIRLVKNHDFNTCYEDILMNDHLLNGLTTWNWDGSSSEPSYFCLPLSKYETDDHDAQKPQGLRKNGVIGKRFAVRVDKRYARTNLLLKYNCQSRQLILSCHSKMQLKRDQ